MLQRNYTRIGNVYVIGASLGQEVVKQKLANSVYAGFGWLPPAAAQVVEQWLTLEHFSHSSCLCFNGLLTISVNPFHSHLK